MDAHITWLVEPAVSTWTAWWGLDCWCTSARQNI